MTPALPAGRRLPRPAAVVDCHACGQLVGRGYPDCPACLDAVERYWRADWVALLATEGIAPDSPDEQLLAAVVLAEHERHAWTVADMATTLLRCEACGGPLAGGPRDCAACAFAFGNLWAPGLEASASGNEHALRVGRWVLRHPHRHSALSVAGWRLMLPHLLTGALPTTSQAQAIRAWLNAGRGDELLPYRDLAALAAHIRPARQ